jgi:phosphoesterase RecJ-like protein
MVDRTVMVKISFRSKGSVPANEFSAMHFKGGGHLNAAGGQSSEPLEVTERRFLEALENFYPQIIRDEKH